LFLTRQINNPLNKLINNILGQTDAVVRRQEKANIKGKDYGPEIYPQ